MAAPDIRVEIVEVGDLREHPRNYRAHPADQILHIRASLREHGFYRNVVVARDLTILAGHGVVMAARAEGFTAIPVVRLPIEPNSPAAIRVLAGDNEIANLAADDDRALTELLRKLMEDSGGPDALLGTGYDQQQLAALALVTRPASELQDFDAAAEWVGMPEYEEGGTPVKLIISFPSDERRAQFCEAIHLKLDKTAVKGTTFSTRWPWTDREDSASIQFDASAAPPDVAQKEPAP